VDLRTAKPLSSRQRPTHPLSRKWRPAKQHWNARLQAGRGPSGERMSCLVAFASAAARMATKACCD